MNEFEYQIKANEVQTAKYAKDLERIIRDNSEDYHVTGYSSNKRPDISEKERKYMLLSKAHFRFKEKSVKDLPDFLYCRYNSFTKDLFQYYFGSHPHCELPTYDHMVKIFKYRAEQIVLDRNEGIYLINFSKVVEDRQTTFNINWSMHVSAKYSYLTDKVYQSGYAPNCSAKTLNHHLSMILQLENTIDHLPRKDITYTHINEFLQKEYASLTSSSTQSEELEDCDFIEYFGKCLTKLGPKIKQNIIDRTNDLDT